MKKRNTKTKKLIRWFLSDEPGLSSRAIVAKMEGIELSYYHHPLDPADLGRCIRLLEWIPEYRTRLNEMREVSQVWANFVDHWDELEALYYEELPSGKAPKCYQRMQELQA